MDNKIVIQCPFNKNHSIPTFKLIPHIHKCKDGRGKIDKLLKCKKDSTILFFDKEEHSKECKKCYKFYFIKEIEKSKHQFLPKDKNHFNSESISIITANFTENNDDISSIPSKSDFGSFLISDVSGIKNERDISNKKSNSLKREISDLDLSNISRKI